MSKENLKKVNTEWMEHLKSQGVTTAVFYEPFTEKKDLYWNQKVKFAFCNFEPYNGKEKVEGMQVLSEEIFFDNWAFSKTISSTLKINYCLSQAFNGVEITTDVVKGCNLKDDKTYDMVSEDFLQSAYFNFRLTVNDTGSANADTDSLYKFYAQDEFNVKQYKKYIEALETNILIVSGEIGCNLINLIYPDLHLQFDSDEPATTAEAPNLQIFSIKHPSRISTEYIAEKVNIIKDYV